MKNREKAEARANELFPFNVDASVSAFNKAQREAFLKCYDEMEKARQKEALIEITETGDSAKQEITCGYCVKRKGDEK